MGTVSSELSVSPRLSEPPTPQWLRPTTPRVWLRSSPPLLPTDPSQLARTLWSLSTLLPQSPTTPQSTTQSTESTQLPTTRFTQLPTTQSTQSLIMRSTQSLITPSLTTHLLSTLPQLMPLPLLLTSQPPPTRPRNTPMRSPPTPSPTPWLMTTPSPTSSARRSPMVPATWPDLTLLLFPTAGSST